MFNQGYKGHRKNLQTTQRRSWIAYEQLAGTYLILANETFGVTLTTTIVIVKVGFVY